MSKPGFIYFKSDTNRYQDIKIKRLKKDFKGIGVCVHDYILNEIYRDKGYFIKWDDNIVFDVAEYWGICEDDVVEIVAGCLKIGLFNDAKYTKYGILTSKAIQVRYVEWSKQAKRSTANIQEEYLVFPEEMAKLPEELTPTQKLQEETDIVEYSIVEESKEEKSNTPNGVVGLAEPTPNVVKEVSISERCKKFIEKFNELRGTKFQATDKVKGSLNARLKVYNSTQIIDAIKAAQKDEYHIKSNFQYLTPEYILRESVLERFLNTAPPTNKKTGNVHQTTLQPSRTGFRVQGGK